MSTQSTLSKFEKEKLKLIQEKCQTLLNEMLRDEDNKYCVDCDAKGPRWASWNLGVFLCIRCAGIHRNLGVHISRVKSVNLDSWTPEQVVTMQQMGNSRARAVYEANMPDTLRRPQMDSALESFIRAKYEHKKYIAKEWVQSPPVKVNWDAEVEESLRKKREAKKIGSSDIGLFPTPAISKPPKVSPTITAKPPVIDLSKVVASKIALESTPNGHTLHQPPPPPPPSASDDLFGLMTDAPPSNFVGLQSPPITNASGSVTKDEFGGLFSLTTTESSGSADLGKLTKESILSLYGSAPTTPINPFLQPVPGGATTSGPIGTSFGNITPGNIATSGSTQTFQPGFSYTAPNSNIHSHSSHSTIMGQQYPNSFSGGNQFQNLASSGTNLQDVNQVQNQLFGLNFGNYQLPPQQHTPQSMTPMSGQYQQPQNSTQVIYGQPQYPHNQNLMGPSVNNFMSSSMYHQTHKSENLPGLGNSVSQLMQSNFASGSNFWK